MNSYVSRSKLLSAVAIPAGLFAGSITELTLKLINPSDVDISASLAYLRPVMLVGVGTVLALFFASLVCIVTARRKGEDTKAIKNALLVLVAIVLMIIGSAIAQNRIDAKEKTYSNQKVKDFFQQLQNRKKD